MAATRLSKRTAEDMALITRTYLAKTNSHVERYTHAELIWQCINTVQVGLVNRFEFLAACGVDLDKARQEQEQEVSPQPKKTRTRF